MLREARMTLLQVTYSKVQVSITFVIHDHLFSAVFFDEDHNISSKDLALKYVYPCICHQIEEEVSCLIQYCY